jgi:hypothetical protein
LGDRRGLAGWLADLLACLLGVAWVACDAGEPGGGWWLGPRGGIRIRIRIRMPMLCGSLGAAKVWMPVASWA